MNKFKNNLDRILDLLFVDKELYMSVNNCLFPIFSNSIHHIALTFEFKILNFFKTEISSLFKYNFLKANYTGITSYINNLPIPSALIRPGELSNFYNTFLSSLKEAIELYVPKLKIKNTSKPPWFNKRLINLNNKKNKAYKLLRNSCSDANLRVKYIELERSFNVLNKFLYKNYIYSIESKLKKNSKCFWSFIKDKKNSNGIPKSMQYLGTSFTSLPTICDAFAEFFKSNYLNSTNIHNFSSEPSLLVYAI